MKKLLLVVVLAAAGAIAEIPESLRVGGALVREGGYAQALPLLEQAVQDTRAKAPDLLPAAMNFLARANQGLGRYALADGWYRRAIAAYESLDRQDPQIAVVLGNLLSLYLEQGQPGPGRLVANRLERWMPDQLPGSPEDRRHVLIALAAFRVLTREEQLAEETLLRALAIPGGTDPVQEASILNELGRLSALAGRNAQATTYLTQAFERLERGLGPDHPSQIQVLQNLALAYDRQHLLNEATSASRRALSLSERTLPGTHPVREKVMLGHADLLRKSGQKGEAKRLETQARSLRVEPADDTSRYVVDVTELRTRRP